MNRAREEAKTLIETTFIRPGYRRTNSGHKPVDGVQFFSYSIGVLSYARISEDGQIFIADNGHHRHSYGAAVIGHGTIQNASGKTKRFRTQQSATEAAVKVWRKMQERKWARNPARARRLCAQCGKPPSRITRAS